ncbi:hypothetical protein PGT21_023317 [Puccinia graminis f. sp. tritici]|nr:hypothetical protein PGTUg99_004523 [Puccinia graminis f. sp. tritici]KAA1087130.1 hypothetical protein PGT21_023317 [Puccinia graminis f. sp. tritici]
MRRNTWMSAIFTISCLTVFDHLQCVQSFGDIKDVSSASKRIASAADSDPHVSVRREESPPKKRARESLGTSRSLSRTGSSSEDLIITSENTSSLRTGKCALKKLQTFPAADKLASLEVDKNVWRCYMQTLKAFNNWMLDFLRLPMDLAEKETFREQMKTVIKSLSQLFEQKIYELRGQEFTWEPLPSDVSLMIGEKWKVAWLSSVADISKTWKNLDPKSRRAGSIIRRGSDLMIDSFIDMDRLGIISPGCLSHFLNKVDRGNLIATHVISRYSFKFPNIYDVYLNLNTKLSLTECPSTKKMTGLMRELEPGSWERIEFYCLRNWLIQYQSIYPKEGRFAAIKDRFLEVASPDNEFPVTKLQAFLGALFTHISSQSRIRENEKAKKLTEFKFLYDMMSFIMSYRSSSISAEFMGGMQRSWLLDQIRAFEESVGLISSIMYSVHVRRKATLLTIPTRRPVLRKMLAKMTDKLVDSSSNRRISSFSDFADGDLSSGSYEQQAKNNAWDLESKTKPPALIQALSTDPIEIRDSIEKINHQFRNYRIQLEALKQRHAFIHPTFCAFVGDFSPLSVYLLRVYELEVERTILHNTRHR